MNRTSRLTISVAMALAAGWLALAAPLGQTSVAPPDPAVAQMVADVSKDRLAETIAALTSVKTRYTTTAGCRFAGTSIYNFLSRLGGLDVQYDPFTYSTTRLPGSGRNIIATLPGTATTPRVLVIGAHYDSMSTDQFRLAPGADDNASGVAVVLELARILSRHHFETTIKFVAFDAEEVGTEGSAHVAGLFKRSGDAVAAVFNLDMVGYSDKGKHGLALIPNLGDQWLAQRFQETTTRYGVTLKTVKRSQAKWSRSDQASFWSAGYPAVDISEDEPDSNPYYHRIDDTPDKLDMDFLTAVARAMLATLAELAGGSAKGR